VDVGNKLLSRVIKGFQEVWFLAVAAVNPDLGESQPKRAGMMNNIKSKFGLCFENYVCGNTGTFAPLPIVRQLLWKVEASINQRCGWSVDQRGKKANLAVVDFAEATAPLPRDTDRLFAFLGHTGFINNQASVRSSSKMAVAVQGHLIHYRAVVPGRY